MQKLQPQRQRSCQKALQLARELFKKRDEAPLCGLPDKIEPCKMLHSEWGTAEHKVSTVDAEGSLVPKLNANEEYMLSQRSLLLLQFVESLYSTLAASQTVITDDCYPICEAQAVSKGYCSMLKCCQTTGNRCLNSGGTKPICALTCRRRRL